MDTNDIITGKIPQSSGGLRKTYIESIIALSNNLGFGLAYKKHLFYRYEDGKIYWGDDEEEYNKYINDPSLKKVELLSVFPIDDNKAFIEIIEPEILKMHLIEEAQYAHALLETEQKKLIK